MEIGLGHEEEARGEPSRPWLGAVDGTSELDSTALGSFIDGLEHFALSLRGLRRRYDTVVRAVSRRLSARGTP